MDFRKENIYLIPSWFRSCRSQGLSTGISSELSEIFQKPYVQNTLDDCSVSAKVLSINHILFVFPFIIDTCNYGSMFRKCVKLKIFLFFTLVYPKIKMNALTTISLWWWFAEALSRKHRFPSAKASAITEYRGEFRRLF